MDDIIVIDDVISISQQNYIEKELITSHTFPWIFNSTDLTYGSIISNGICFSSKIMDQDKVINHNFHNLLPVIHAACDKSNLSISKMLRMSAFLTFKKNTNHIMEPHNDFDIPHYGCLYYVNESDGDTIFYNKFYPESKNDLIEIKRVNPKKGRCVLFNPLRYHSSSFPEKKEYRCIVNTNFIS
jgi:hypothetical protein